MYWTVADKVMVLVDWFGGISVMPLDQPRDNSGYITYVDPVYLAEVTNEDPEFEIEIEFEDDAES